jgi:hypothetical protein
VLARILLCLTLSVLPRELFAQAATTVQPPRFTQASQDSLVAKLPPQLRAAGQQLLAEPDDAERADLAEDLFELDEENSIEFLLGVLARDPSPEVRIAIIEEIGDEAGERIVLTLRQHARSDPSPEVSLAALRVLYAVELEDLTELLDERLAKARESGDTEQLRLLAREQQQYRARAEGANLPSFLQTPPPVFSVKPRNRPIRVAAFGDYGTGEPEQKAVAAALLKYHKQHPLDFGITMGDNFYSDGMESPSDPRWKTWWSDLYDPLGIPFYATLGNHDWHFADSPAAEVMYTKQSKSWRMPATYYTYTAGPVQFFALETVALSAMQLMWLREELERSTARWKVVYGHHPIYSAGQHGDDDDLIEQLLPVLRGRADIYLAGHDHDMQHLKPEGKLHFFVAGSGGKLRPITPGPRSLFALSSTGFAILEASDSRLLVRFIDPELRTRYEYTLTK